MNKLKTVDKDAGIDVLQVWLFDLPELAYMASIESIEKKKEFVEVKADLDSKKGTILLEIHSNYSNQSLRDAEVERKIRERYSDVLKTLNELNAEVEKLKAQATYYEAIFKSVKDRVYYEHRQIELGEMKEINKQKAEAFK